MPYALKLDLYRFVAGVLVTAIAVWPAPLGLFVSLSCAFLAAYL